jgi:hypothetical protein
LAINLIRLAALTSSVEINQIYLNADIHCST